MRSQRRLVPGQLVDKQPSKYSSYQCSRPEKRMKRRKEETIMRWMAGKKKKERKGKERKGKERMDGWMDE